jgi:hypothetical protein
MKRFISILVICVLCSCTKELQTPLDTSQNVTQDLAKKSGGKHNAPKTVSYTNQYLGDSGEGFDISFPAFDVNTGTLTGWTLTVTRKVTGNIVLTNTLTTRNDSSISISRYLCVTESGTIPICTCPTAVTEYLRQSLAANRTAKVPVNTTVTDVVNNTATNLNYVQGDATGVLSWHFNDIISAFKPNCTNDYTLADNITIKVTYSFITN